MCEHFRCALVVLLSPCLIPRAELTGAGRSEAIPRCLMYLRGQAVMLASHYLSVSPGVPRYRSAPTGINKKFFVADLTGFFFCASVLNIVFFHNNYYSK